MGSPHHTKNTSRAQASSNASRWLTHYLAAKIFLKLPAKNLQVLISQLREINVAADELITSAGDSADFYYIIKEGTVDLSFQQQSISTLGEGEGFGEDLLSKSARYIFDVRALTNSTLMQLPREGFIDLLLSPITQIEKKPALPAEGIILNTNPEKNPAPQTQHAPYPQLRTLISTLDPQAHYFVTHHDQGLCQASAFVLNQHGYHATATEEPLTKATSAIQTNDDELGANIASELADIENQLKSLETLITPTTPTEKKKTTPPRNPHIHCIERDDEQLWTPIILPSASTPKPATPPPLANKTNAPSEPAEESKACVQKEESQPTANWLSDEYVWEKVLGFDPTDEVDALIEDESTRYGNGTPRNEAPPSVHNIASSINKIAPIRPLQIDPIHNTPPPPPVSSRPKPKVKRHGKISFFATTCLAIIISALPFAFPNTWNDYYQQASALINPDKINQVMTGLGELKRNLSSNINSSGSNSINDTSTVAAPSAPINIAQQKQLLLEHVRSQAKAEFSRKLAAARPIPYTPQASSEDTAETQNNTQAPPLPGIPLSEIRISSDTGAASHLIEMPSPAASHTEEN